jgi:hypothetical protein
VDCLGLRAKALSRRVSQRERGGAAAARAGERSATVEATSLVCVGGVAVLYSGRWFALSSRKARVQGNIGQRTLAWAKIHLRYLACGHTLQPLCNRLCSHDRNHLVWTDGGHSSSTPTGPAFASTNRLPARGAHTGLPAVAASAGREMVRPFKTQSRWTQACG